jgi:four helix bundle protein
MTTTARGFQDLIVWQKAHFFVCAAYRFSRNFPKDELFGLQSQLRRAAVSIAANIAEGFKKTGRQDKLRYLNIAQASAEECRYYLLLSRDLGYGECGALTQSVDEVSKLLHGYMTAIRTSGWQLHMH